MSSHQKPTADTLWPTVSGAGTFSDLCRLLYGRGVLDLPLVERIAIADALATRLGLEIRLHAPARRQALPRASSRLRAEGPSGCAGSRDRRPAAT